MDYHRLDFLSRGDGFLRRVSNRTGLFPRNHRLEFQRGRLGFTCPGYRLLCATSTANSRKAEEVRNCLTDEGRPLGVGLQEQAPNHLRRLWPKATVVNAEGKGLELLSQVTGKKMSVANSSIARNCRGFEV